MFAIALFTSAFLHAAPVPPDTDPAQAECARWQGTWRVTEMEITTGKRTARLKFTEHDEAAWHIEANVLELAGLKFPFTKARLTFDPAQAPKRISLTFVDGPQKDQKIEGTFSRDGDRIDVDFPRWPKEKDESAQLKFSLQRQGK
jgi:uncharacterized protein (TIGR03067 family)